VIGIKIIFTYLGIFRTRYFDAYRGGIQRLRIKEATYLYQF
jgi:hypothetical protein